MADKNTWRHNVPVRQESAEVFSDIYPLEIIEEGVYPTQLLAYVESNHSHTPVAPWHSPYKHTFDHTEPIPELEPEYTALGRALIEAAQLEEKMFRKR